MNWLPPLYMVNIYTVVNIFRIDQINLQYIIELYKDQIVYYKVSKSLSDRMSRGMVFQSDKIIITSQNEEGIIFEVYENDDGSSKEIKSRETSQLDLYYGDTPIKILPFSHSKLNFFPYLCDILPYSINEIKEISGVVPIHNHDTFQGKYLIENKEVSNIKIPLPSSFIAKIHQKTRINTYPTVFNPFLFIIISSNNIFIKAVIWHEHLKNFSSLNVGDVIMVKDFKPKKKWAFIDKVDYNTFTESVYFDCEEITIKDLVKIKMDRQGLVKHLFCTIEGEIEYMSILMRCRLNDCLMEYVLLRVDGKNVVLFYNSDNKFVKIRLKTQIKIVELRKDVRAGFEYYVSTIFTQFTLIDEKNEKDPKESEFKKLKPNINENESPDYIFGAIGYFPDNFKSLQEILEYSSKEVIHCQEIYFSLFMRPVLTNIDDIKKQKLVLNESKKFIFSGIITNILTFEPTVDFYMNDVCQKQSSLTLIFDNRFECLAYENFFNQKACLFGSIGSKEGFEEIIGQSLYFVVEAFRNDENSILYYLTGIIKE